MEGLAQELLAQPLLQEIGDEAPAAAAWLAQCGKLTELDAGTDYLKEGDPIDNMSMVLSGRLELLLRGTDGQTHLASEMTAGTVSGALPYSRLVKTNGQLRVVEAARLFQLPRTCFPDLIRQFPNLTEALVHQMTNRVRQYTREESQQQKLAGLGLMAAGLAHELNNPAGAIASASAELARRLAALQTALAADPACQGRPAWPAPGQPITDALDRADAEEALGALLQKLGSPNAYIRAGTLVDAGYAAKDLQAFAAHGAPEETLRLMSLYEDVTAMAALVELVRSASGSISRLVSSIKTFSHMDQAQSLQTTPAIDTLAAALDVMAYKFRQKNVDIKRDLPAGLPGICAMPGELAQVWSNLLDNAIAAAAEAHPDGGGTVRVSAHEEGSYIAYAIEDNGPGIPDALRERIYEPFFSTKGPGEGTGLGLDIVRKILERHHAERRLESAPGKTVFTVLVPRAG